MSNFLDTIQNQKAKEIELAKSCINETEIVARAKDATPVRNFKNALDEKVSNGNFALIAELKKGSPTEPLIRENFDPVSLAKSYEAGGAACLSVLTDKKSFKGCKEYLIKARSATSLPVLRKDFMYEPYQVYEARMWNADCILIILAAVSDDQAKVLEETALKLDMSVLIEIHNEKEFERANKLESKLLEINNRNLNNLETSLEVCEKIAPSIGSEFLIVGASGIKTNQDLRKLSKRNIYSFLVGESLMKQPDVEMATRKLLAQ